MLDDREYQKRLTEIPMAETVPIEPVPPEERVVLLVEQVWLFQAYALSLAHVSGLSPEEAAGQFFDGIAVGRAAREAGVEEIGRIATSVASFLQVTYGNALVRRDGEVWFVQTQLDERANAALALWHVPRAFFVRWAAEVQRREGDLLQIEWHTRLEGDIMRQELRPGRSG